MLYLPTEEMDINKFVEVQLPTKEQIFARTGQHSVAGGNYGEDIRFASTPTESADRFARAAEAYESPKSEDESKSDKK